MKKKTARIEKKRKEKLPLDFSPRTKTSLVTSTHRLVITRRVSLERSALACRVSAFIPARTLTPWEGGGHFAHPVLGKVKLYTVRWPPCVWMHDPPQSTYYDCARRPRLRYVPSSDLFRLIDTWREPILSRSYSVILQLQLRSCSPLSFNRCSSGGSREYWDFWVRV